MRAHQTALLCLFVRSAFSAQAPECNEWKLAADCEPTEQVIWEQTLNQVAVLQTGLQQLNAPNVNVRLCTERLGQYDPGSSIMHLGRALLRWAYDMNREYADTKVAPLIAVAAIVAHEFAHAIQYTVIKDERYGNSCARKAMELEADALAAAYIKSQFAWNDTIVENALSIFYLVGDTDFLGDHHGIPRDRVWYARLGLQSASFGKPVEVQALHKIAFRPEERSDIFVIASEKASRLSRAVSGLAAGLAELERDLTSVERTDRVKESFDALLVRRPLLGTSCMLFLYEREGSDSAVVRVIKEVLRARCTWMDSAADRQREIGPTLVGVVRKARGEVKSLYVSRVTQIALDDGAALAGRFAAITALKNLGAADELVDVAVRARARKSASDSAVESVAVERIGELVGDDRYSGGVSYARVLDFAAKRIHPSEGFTEDRRVELIRLAAKVAEVTHEEATAKRACEIVGEARQDPTDSVRRAAVYEFERVQALPKMSWRRP